MKTKIGFEVIKMVDIPNTFILGEVMTHLRGREIFADTDELISDRIFSGDTFDKILEERNEMLSEAAIKQIIELAVDLKEFELFRVVGL